MRPAPQSVRDKIAAKETINAAIKVLHGSRGGIEVNYLVQLLTIRLEEAKNDFLTVPPEQFETLRERARVYQELLSEIETGPRGVKEQTQ